MPNLKFGTPDGCKLEFQRDIWHQKTTVLGNRAALFARSHNIISIIIIMWTLSLPWRALVMPVDFVLDFVPDQC